MASMHTRSSALLATLAIAASMPDANASSQTTELMPPQIAANDFFGNSVSINASGTAAVGAPGVSGNRGAVYLFDSATGANLRTLQASDRAFGDQFGYSAGIAQDTLVVGAPFKSVAAYSSGAVYVIEASTGTETRMLAATDSGSADYFGYSVAISGTTAVVGAPGDNASGGPGIFPTESGFAYLFDTTTGTQIAKLVPLDGQVGDFFGQRVAISGNTVLVGASQHDANGTNSGAVYVFDATTGAQTSKWTALDGAPHDHFGYSVAVSGSTAIVGAMYADSLTLGGGAAYLFDVGTNAQIDKLTPLDAMPGEPLLFGLSVAIHGDRAAIGAPLDDEFGNAAGSVYYFETASGTQLAKLGATVGLEDDDWFGHAVAIGSESIVCGTPNISDNGIAAGAAYAFAGLPFGVSYCTAGISASGCQALLSADGVPSSTASSGFNLMATGVEGQRDGLFFLGTNGRQAKSWGNGSSLQCVVPPVSRAGLLPGIGNSGLCNGAFDLDLNSHWTTKPAQNPGAGAVVQAQLWYRDPLNTSNQTTSLSDAIEFLVAP